MAQLTPRQRKFVDEYLVDLNATQAYIRAGYRVKSKDIARVNASRLLANANVQEAVGKAMQERSKRVRITSNQVVEQLAKIAFTDVKDFVRFGQREIQIMGDFGPIRDSEGNPVTKVVNFVDFKQDHEVDGTILAEVKIGKDGASMKLNDRMRALEMLGRHLGMFNDKIDITGETTINITLVDDDDSD